MIIVGGNREARFKGAALRIIATILIFPLWLFMIDRCNRSDDEKLCERYNLKEINLEKKLKVNKIVRTDSSVIRYVAYIDDNLYYATEFIPMNKLQLERTLDQVEKVLNRENRETIKMIDKFKKKRD